jgi:hypothetical protein
VIIVLNELASASATAAATDDAAAVAAVPLPLQSMSAKTQLVDDGIYNDLQAPSVELAASA